VRNPDGFARQWQILMIGSIIAAYAGRPERCTPRKEVRGCVARRREYWFARPRSPMTSLATEIRGGPRYWKASAAYSTGLPAVRHFRDPRDAG